MNRSAAPDTAPPLPRPPGDPAPSPLPRPPGDPAPSPLPRPASEPPGRRHRLVHAARASWRTAALAAGGATADGLVFLSLDYALRFLRVALLLSVWRVILTTTGPEATVGGLTPAAVLTYTLAAAVFADPLSARSGLDEGLWNGSVAVRMLQPGGLMLHYAAEMVAAGCPDSSSSPCPSSSPPR